MDPLQQSPPSIGAFVDQLISELAKYRAPAVSAQVNAEDQPRAQAAQQKQPRNVLERLPPPQLAQIKPLILTLHCLFPNDLLPALDILDRKLVQHLVRADRLHAVASHNDHAEPSSDQPEKQNTDHKNVVEDLFLVTSASAAPPYPTREQEKGYEVRLRAWNCTCPSFSLLAYRDSGPIPDSLARSQPHAAEMQDQNGSIVYPFGGSLTRAPARVSPPVCKHILACVLCARCPGLFGVDHDGRRLVSMEELAGWCAGWGG
ncbi:hypothetical protein NUU61_002508 [Penicillium alfredii]|uniref:SWIM-type domain-containing protein n=1 Tax=Penicillium alfredii TaxID=1506179 RepID=A0A9W9FRL8_9EURO|nr:uncharacterized protein NUU61_002508 [Penicillium alfredii]KAJ5105161.1 hypothetical protein NUU61_002508 [Penicillium alfredii]